MLLTLLGILIHGENTQNHLLVLEVALGNQLLESFPVLGCELGVHVSIHFDFLQLLLQIVATYILTLLGQLLVEVELTIGAGISTYLNVGESTSQGVVIDFLQNLTQVLHAHAVELAGTQSGLIDEELDVGFLLLGDDTLISIGSCGSSDITTAEELAGGYHAITDLHLRDLHCLLTHLSIEASIKVALYHGVYICEVGLHGISTAHLILDGGTITFYLFALECRTLTYSLTTFILQHGSNSHLCLLLHVLGGESTIDSSRYLTSNCLQRSRCNIEIVSAQLTELAARCEHQNRC